MTATPPSPAPRPLVIWTLRGSGAQALAAALHTRAPTLAALHEPLNPGRVWGALTTDWLATRDEARLADALARACASPALVTHAVELVPPPVSAALAAAACLAGAAHLFVYRRSAGARLAALGPAFTPAHEAACVQRLQAVWDALVARGQRPLALAHEDVFAAPEADALGVLRVVLERLGLSQGAAGDAPWVGALRAVNAPLPPASAPPAPALRRALARLPAFMPVSPWQVLQVQALPLPPGVLHVTLDTLPLAHGPTDLTRLGGVVVTAQGVTQPRLGVRTALGQPLPAPAWHMPSPRMRTQFPGSANGAKARYFWRMAAAPDALVLTFRAQGMDEPVPLLAVHRAPATLADVGAWLNAQVDAPQALALAALRRTLDELAVGPGQPDDAQWHEVNAWWQALAARVSPDPEMMAT